MNWTDDGILLHVSPHGESSLIATFLTQNHGLARGYLRFSKKSPPTPGNIYHINYKARLSAHLGLVSIEQHESFALAIFTALQSPLKLACINSMRTLLMKCLIDQDSHDHTNEFYNHTQQHLTDIALHSSLASYAFFELNLLQYCGFGLDLQRCAVTNTSENLIYVSPKTGRAVTEEVGTPYKDQLLNLPSFLIQNAQKNTEHDEIMAALKLTGFFLSRMLNDTFHRQLPDERNYLLSLIKKHHYA